MCPNATPENLAADGKRDAATETFWDAAGGWGSMPQFVSGEWNVGCWEGIWHARLGHPHSLLPQPLVA